MSEEKMVHAVQEALRERGVEDEVIAAGQFNPRGHSGGMFVGGLAGDSAGGVAGNVGSALGTVAGIGAGEAAADAATGLPAFMLVGVTANAVYGFAGRSRSKTPTDLVFEADRSDLEAKVHQRDQRAGAGARPPRRRLDDRARGQPPARSPTART